MRNPQTNWDQNTDAKRKEKKKKLNQAAAAEVEEEEEEEATTNKTPKKKINKFKRNWLKKNCWRRDLKNSQFIWVSKKLQNSHLKS